ncbi:MAG: hypothetical protein V8S87_08180 [Oscillospiraceae bacterium]
MTNLTDEDINRLIALKISPINISVQVTDDERPGDDDEKSQRRRLPCAHAQKFAVPRGHSDELPDRSVQGD